MKVLLKKLNIFFLLQKIRMLLMLKDVVNISEIMPNQQHQLLQLHLQLFVLHHLQNKLHVLFLLQVNLVQLLLGYNSNHNHNFSHHCIILHPHSVSLHQSLWLVVLRVLVSHHNNRFILKFLLVRCHHINNETRCLLSQYLLALLLLQILVWLSLLEFLHNLLFDNLLLHLVSSQILVVLLVLVLLLVDSIHQFQAIRLMMIQDQLQNKLLQILS